MSTTHPLEPLSMEEFECVVDIIKKQCRSEIEDEFTFGSVNLLEPPKTEVYNWLPGSLTFRKSSVVVLNNAKRTFSEVVVDLLTKKVESIKILKEQPALTPTEYALCEKVVTESPEVKAALLKRGVTDMSTLRVDLWAVGYGYNGEEHDDKSGLRLAKPLLFIKDHDSTHGYARPVEGLEPVVDLVVGKLHRLDDFYVVPIPPDTTKTMKEFESQKTIKPLHITQPLGPSFTVNGWEIKWLGWSFRLGFNSREGVTLHNIGYQEAPSKPVRPILYRASLSEMVVPYGDPRSPHYRKNALDVGEEGIGFNINSLSLGCDCVGLIKYFDVIIVEGPGNLRTVKQAICLHEEDAGLLHKHTDWRNGVSDVRRARRLVVSSTVTVANYDYAFYWYFGQDGAITFNAKMTGIVNVIARPPNEENIYGQKLPAPGLWAPVHQHFFCLRLDTCIDGPQNSIYEVNCEPHDSSINLQRNSFVAKSTQLKSELQAVRDYNPASYRHWKIVNPNKKNIVGQPTAYKILPETNAFPFADPANSPILRRVGFLSHQLWVTPFDKDERYPTGEYPNQVSTVEGLPKWTRKDRSLDNTDLVVWYTVGATHVVRLEDWPIMPVANASVTFAPAGFFDHSPTIQTSNSYCSNSAKL